MHKKFNYLTSEFMGNMFTIITVCFNSEKTIERTLKSVLAQTFSNYEYIIVDGASIDNTINIVKNYESSFKGRMKWISETDNGIYDAMNKGIKMSNGEIIGIVNSDDWLEPDALQTVHDAYIKNGNSLETLYIGWMNFHYDENNYQVLKTSQEKFTKMVKHYQMAGINHPATFVPKAIYDKLGAFDDRMNISADADFILRCYFNQISFQYINKVLTNMSGDGVSNSSSWKFIKKAYLDRKIMLNKYIKNIYYYIYYQMCWIVKIVIKRFIPSIILKKYRRL